MNLLMAMTHARLLADSLTAAYYLDCAGGYCGRTGTRVKTASALDQFAKLAAELGYRLEKIEANPAQPIAA